MKWTFVQGCATSVVGSVAGIVVAIIVYQAMVLVQSIGQYLNVLAVSIVK